MPHQLKNRAAGTDAGAMSETALTPPNDTTPTAPEQLATDGDAPRLGSAPITPPAPMGGAGTSVFDDTPGAPTLPTLPVVSPVLSDPSAPMQAGLAAPKPTAAPAPVADIPTPTIPEPSLPTATQSAPVAPTEPTEPTAATIPAVDDQTPTIPEPSLPSLPTVAPAAPSETTDSTETTATGATSATGEADHPMAHLMEGKSKPSEASQRAAQMRAAKKAKAKKIKIYTAVGALVVSVLVGPPLWSWFTNALAEAGGTTTEQPTD